MDKNTFFTDTNKDLLYNLCRDEIVKQINYNIDTNKKYYHKFGQIMGIVFKHADNKNDLGSLNTKTLSKTIPYLIQTIQDKNRKKISKNTNEVEMPYMERPNKINIEKENDLKSNYQTLMNERKQFFGEDNVVQTMEVPQNNDSFEDPKSLYEKQLK